ncbi:DNA-directed RNA polymerase subunit beta [Halobacillus locisalis]|uniref:DNA-directed RNA polymerase subunit beta n=1 Tax=Halobacillus locisalis TaxID=220753 RepID=A0A838CT25_9BACI|nr:DNA-directed RNA polymerase subunit beta [Halobacillus locisalis]MBA2175292.1 DNA-directed RNA polymerase subunit beta [Halobacillus locisalis]
MATDPKSEKNKTRAEEKERKKVAKQEKKGTKKAKKEKKPKKGRRRILPIWLRILIVLLLSALALVLGVMVGYGIIGDGNPTDALEWDTWQHIFDIVTKTE